MNEDKIISVKNLSKVFGDFTAVNNISFEVNKGEIFGFLGANGAGKTTAMKMLIGISKPSSGEATVAGFDVKTNSEMVKKSIGYMSQKFSMYDDLTIKENITFFGGIYGLTKSQIKEKTTQLIEELQLEEVANKLVGSLPLGWKQGTTLFVTTHYMDEAEYCDRVSIMVEGKIEALDTPKTLKKQFNVDSMNEVFLKLARNIE